MKNNNSIFIPTILIIASLLLLPSAASGGKSILFEAKPPQSEAPKLPDKTPDPKPEEKINIPAVKKEPPINKEQEKLFAQNLKDGIKAFKEKNYEASISLLEESLISIKFLPHKKNTAKSIYKLLVQASVKLKDHKQSVNYQSRVVNLIRKEGEDGDMDELAKENLNLGHYHFLAKDNESAADFYYQALTHYKELEYDDKSAEIYSDLGKLYEADSKYDLTLWAYQELYKLHKKNDEIQKTGIPLRKMGAILFERLNKYSDAEKYFSRANKIFLESKNMELTSETYLDLGLVEEKKANIGKARKYYKKAQTIAEENNFPLTLSRAYFYLGNLQWFQGKRKESFKTLKKSLLAAETDNGEKQRLMVFNKIGLIYKDMNESSTALNYLNKSLKLAKEIRSPLDEASALNNIGLVYQQDKNFEKSSQHFQEALDIYKNHNSKKGQSFSLLNLAINYRHIERLRESDSHISEAIQINRELADEPNLVKSLREKLSLVAFQNKTVDMKSIYRELEALVRKSFGEGHPDMANLYNFQAMLNAKTEHYSTALKYLTKEFTIQENLIKNALPITNEKQKLEFIQSFSNSFQTSLSMIHQNFASNPKFVDLGLNMTLRYKGAALDAQSLAGKSLRNQMNQKVQKLWDQAISLQAQLSHLMLNKPPQIPLADYLETISSLKAKLKKIEAHLSKKSILAKMEFQRRDITTKAVAEKIPENSALVEFIKFNDYDFDNSRLREKRYIAFVLKRDGTVNLIDLGLTDSLEQQVKKTLRIIRTSQIDPLKVNTEEADSIGYSRAALKSLYQKLWAPLEGSLAGINNIIISPDGYIHQVPFAALIDNGGRPLIEKLTFALLSSGRELIISDETEFQYKSELLLVANPIYDREASASIANDIAVRSRIFNLKFEPLPESDIEAKIIPEIFPGPSDQKTILIGAKATESAVKNNRRPKTIHFATRGFFLKDADEDLSSLSRYENPLLRTGLALTGANNANDVTFGDDGILTSLEISGLSLYGTELVVLSASETEASDAQTDEGIFGLRRSFTLAGAKNLLINLWSVNQEVVIPQMTNFYKHLKNMPPAKALRRAQLDSIETLKKTYGGEAPPALWGSFILHGAGALHN
ncbi:MAG: CHAT domain-containing tetratricopeptide repeat protein [Nitrospinales bacterium]